MSLKRRIKSAIRQMVLKGKWLLLRPKLPLATEEGYCIHIGCGEIVLPNYINIDARPLSHVHFISKNISRLPFLKNNSAQVIYACHVIEHLPTAVVPKALAEYFRILKPGGILRLSVPDLDRLMEIYQKEGKTIEAIQPILMGGQDYLYNFHQSVFNRAYLEKLLFDAGFKKTREWDPSTFAYNDWSGRSVFCNGTSYAVSLNLEALRIE